MKITVGIEVTGTDGEPVSFTKSISTAEGKFANGSNDSESDGGSAPAEVIAKMMESERGIFDETSWIDAGAAPQPPTSNRGNGDSRPASSEIEDAGGSPLHQSSNDV
jgi:hypothetical protein